MIGTIVIGGWAVCAVLTYGLVLADLQSVRGSYAAWGFSQDRMLALLLAAIGPMGLLAAVLAGGYRSGLLFRNPHRGTP